jgi:hypothetical protein
VQQLWRRRRFLQLASMAVPSRLWSFSHQTPPALADAKPVSDSFPTQPAELALEMVTVSHFSLERVRTLVEARPSLARAAWDWGFGDWETALEAASHMGNRAIAEYLISKGARPSLFSAAMLGQLDVVRAFCTAQPGIQRTRGPHSISLLAHARAGGAAANGVLKYLESLGDADVEQPVPIEETDLRSTLGTYLFGEGKDDVIDVTIEPKASGGQVLWTRKGRMSRTLFYIGNRVFYPAGAPAVRINFTGTSGTIVMTINDPSPVLTARRITGG